jgi:hypothetical protein
MTAIPLQPRPSLWDALRRVRAEYREIPDLRLTQTQAQRLLGLAPAVCALVLRWLVDDGFLVVSNGQFVKR